MRIAVVNLTGGNLSGGYQKYLRSLMPLLRARPEVSALSVYAPRGYDGGAADLPVDVWPDGPARATRRWIRRAVREFAPDVVFIPTARLIRVDDVPTVVMVRNMEPLVREAEKGNPLSDRLRNAARRYEARRACAGASRVIAVSRFVRDVVAQRWNIPGHRIGVVYHGVEQDAPQAPGAAPSIERWVGANPFLFTAGSIRPARGLDDLIDAWPVLRRSFSGLKVVVAGSVDRAGVAHLEALQRRITEAGATGEFLWTGTLGAGEMSWCYSRAAAFVMTSRVEACPNTVLEAMANGAVSVSTDARPMPEFFVNAAVYYAARSADALASAVTRVLRDDGSSRERLRADARARTKDFTWERTAERTVAELLRATAGR